MQYYYSQDGANQQGPCTVDELRAARISDKTLVWRDGMAGWTPAGQVAELAELFQSPAPASGPQRIPSASSAAAPSPWQAPSAHPSQQPLGYGGYPVAQSSPAPNGMAIASLVLGIVSLLSVMVYCFGVIPAVLAVIFGHMSRGQIRKGQGSGDGMALAGLIMGYIVIGLFVAAVVVAILVFAFAATANTGRSPNWP